MLSINSILISKINRICFNRGITSICNQLNEINRYKSLNNSERSERSKRLIPNIIGLRLYSDEKSKKVEKKPNLKLEFIDDKPRLTHTERLKRIIQNYGTTAVVLHITISLTSLGFWYSLLHFGVDITSYVDFDRFGEMGAKVMASSGTFAIAYTIHKMTMPVRVGATVILTPILVNWLRSKGFIKKPHKYI